MKTSRLAPVAAVLTLALGLAGCSGEGDKDKDKDSKQPAKKASIDPSRVSPTDLPKVPEVKRAKGAIADASFGECSSGAGAQKVKGTLTNSTKKRTDYVVTVSWVNDTSDVLARAVSVVEGLPAGKSRDVKVSAKVPDGATSCTFHVVRGNLS